MQEITTRLLKRIEPQFIKHCADFKYIYSLSHAAALNVRMLPSAIPIFWDYVFNGKILTNKDAYGLVKWDVTPTAGYGSDVIVKARLQNFFASVMRELGACFSLKRLFSSCLLYKSYDDDIGDGRVDIWCEMSGGRIPLAISHKGRYSDSYDAKKIGKERVGIVRLCAPCDRSKSGIHLIPDEMILEKLFEYSTAKNS